MKTLCLLVGLTLAFTAVSLAPTGAAWCSITNASPVISGEICSSGDCHYRVLDGAVDVTCPP
jgi:hypothetical protein